ncbi:MAG: zinc ribbon domain-containing protein YjdM [Gammaproteobacteria bacterium]
MIPACPQCTSEYAYEDRGNYVCPECAHEWNDAEAADAAHVVKDANGNELASGDIVMVAKNLKVKGASSVLKAGTKVKNIRVLEADHVVDGHDIDCKIDGFGAMKLKGSVVKKVNS